MRCLERTPQWLRRSLSAPPQSLRSRSRCGPASARPMRRGQPHACGCGSGAARPAVFRGQRVPASELLFRRRGLGIILSAHRQDDRRGPPGDPARAPLQAQRPGAAGAEGCPRSPEPELGGAPVRRVRPGLGRHGREQPAQGAIIAAPARPAAPGGSQHAHKPAAAALRGARLGWPGHPCSTQVRTSTARGAAAAAAAARGAGRGGAGIPAQGQPAGQRRRQRAWGRRGAGHTAGARRRRGRARPQAAGALKSVRSDNARSRVSMRALAGAAAPAALLAPGGAIAARQEAAAALRGVCAINAPSTPSACGRRGAGRAAGARRDDDCRALGGCCGAAGPAHRQHTEAHQRAGACRGAGRAPAAQLTCA